MKEGFLIGGGILVAGLLLQVILGPVEWGLLAGQGVTRAHFFHW
jgi:hypothetical protein